MALDAPGSKFLITEMILPRLVVSVILVTVACIATLQAQSIEELDLDGKRMPDPEFDHVGYQVTWQDENDNLWVASVNSNTGDIDIGNAQMLDRRLAPNEPIESGNATGNGPEWVYTNEGSQILYTRQVGQLGPRNWRVAVARKTGSGWEAGLLNAPGGRAPFFRRGQVVGGAPDGTKLPGDPGPLINYYFVDTSGQRTLMWLPLNNPGDAGVTPFQFSSFGRWVEGEHLLVSTVTVSTIDQVVLFNPTNPEDFTQLTFDRDFAKVQPEMWRAPEFGRRVFCALESPGRRRPPTQVGVYWEEANGTWTKIKTIIPPADRNFPIIHSPEHFVFEGKSYLVMAMKGSSRREGTEIWIAGIDPREDFYLRLAGPELGVGSTDPEYLITTGANPRVLIYLAQGGGRQLFRVDTGL